MIIIKIFEHTLPFHICLCTNWSLPDTWLLITQSNTFFMPYSYFLAMYLFGIKIEICEWTNSCTWHQFFYKWDSNQHQVSGFMDLFSQMTTTRLVFFLLSCCRDFNERWASECLNKAVFSNQIEWMKMLFWWFFIGLNSN